MLLSVAKKDLSSTPTFKRDRVTWWLPKNTGVQILALSFTDSNLGQVS